MTASEYRSYPDVVRRAHSRAATQWVLRLFKWAILLGGGLGMAWCLDTARYIPTRTSVVLLLGVAVLTVALCRFAPWSPLTRLMVVLYAAPFAVTTGYLSNLDFEWWPFPTAVWYMSDRVTVQIMIMTGLVGLLGLVTGYVIASDRVRRPVEVRGRGRTLRPAPFTIALAAAFFFSYINTPPGTIMSSEYTAALGLAGRFNFNAAYLVSYTLLMMLLVDAEQEGRPGLRAAKRVAVFAVTGFVLIFFQVLRGDRDSLGYVVGVAALLLTEPLRHPQARRILRRRAVALFVPAVLLLVVFFALGEIRLRLAYGERVSIVEAVKKGATEQSTATAVLLTNLSLAHSYRFGMMEVERGRTYAWYLLSLPPGFVTSALGIERPLERDRGPNFWFTDISAGGIHVVTVPFKNFLAKGAFLMLAVFGYFIAATEIRAQSTRWINRFWYGCMFVVSAQWFWYGDIVFIREMMAFGAASAVYAIVHSVTALSYAPWSESAS